MSMDLDNVFQDVNPKPQEKIENRAKTREKHRSSNIIFLLPELQNVLGFRGLV